MDWFGRDSLDGLVEGVFALTAALAAAVYGAVEETHTAVDAIESRMGDLETQMETVRREAVSIKPSKDGMLDILPVADIGQSIEGKGADAADGN